MKVQISNYVSREVVPVLFFIQQLVSYLCAGDLMDCLPYTDIFIFKAYIPLDQIGVIDYLPSGNKK